MTTMIKIGPLMLEANAEAIHDKQPLSVTTRRDTADRAYVSLMHMTGADFKQLALVANALDALEFAGLEPYRDGVLERVKKFTLDVTTIDPDLQRNICGAREAARAVIHHANTGRDLFTECETHPQMECMSCDGAHCHRSCDEIARAGCRDRRRVEIAGWTVTAIDTLTKVNEERDNYFRQLAAIDKAVSADAHRALTVELEERTKERDAWERAYNQLSAIHNHRELRSEIDSNESLGLIDHKARI